MSSLAGYRGRTEGEVDRAPVRLPFALATLPLLVDRTGRRTAGVAAEAPPAV